MSRKTDIKVLQQAALRKGGSLLSTEYISSDIKYHWRCSRGHEWLAVYYPITAGQTWCPHCAGVARKSYEELQAEGRIAGVELISPSQEYKNNKTKLLWKCASGHLFRTRFNDIKTGYGCPTCSNVAVPDIEELRKHAQQLGGSLQSTTYINSETRYEWRCENAHTWRASWHSVKTGGTWCPYCAKFKTENQVRHIFERLFNKPFPKCRPIPFLNGKNLELDGFNEELKIAFEFNGIQHYRYLPFFHESKEAFQQQQQRDRAKVLWCSNNKITLFVIPYTEATCLTEFIRKSLIQKGMLHVTNN